MKETIMLLGIHGVGKTFLLSKLSYDNYSASSLIREYKRTATDDRKRVENVEENQNILLNAIQNKNLLGDRFILDGHCCLLNSDSNIERIDKEVFRELALGGIVVLYEDAGVIYERLKKRDELELDIHLIETFQQTELEYARELAEELDVPYLITKSDIERIVSFINNVWR